MRVTVAAIELVRKDGVFETMEPSFAARHTHDPNSEQLQGLNFSFTEVLP